MNKANNFCITLIDTFSYNKGYWPLSPILASIWGVYDSSEDYNTSAHILLASLATIRSLQNPKGYERELILRHPVTSIIIIWFVSLLPWAIIMPIFGNTPYTLNVNFKKNLFIFDVLNLIWLVLLISILAASIWIYVFLNKKSKKKISQKFVKQSLSSQSISNQQQNELATVNQPNAIIFMPSKLKNKLKKFRLSMQSKFLLIMGSYLLLWLPACLMISISPYIYIDPGIFLGIYW
jgi:hypothetical protein